MKTYSIQRREASWWLVELGSNNQWEGVDGSKFKYVVLDWLKELKKNGHKVILTPR
jgi:hypothetical protein